MNFKKWFAFLFKQEPVVEEVEAPLPEDIWERMVELAKRLEGCQLPALDIRYFDVIVNVTTTSAHQLFRRIENVLNCIDIQSDSPEWWGERNRNKNPTTMTAYCYDRRNGYTEPQIILDKLIEKVAVIHHLIASQSINASHDYYHYMRREFFQVVSDIVEVLEACHRLGKPE